jgi:membrane-associated phospholipid phosphatase
MKAFMETSTYQKICSIAGKIVSQLLNVPVLTAVFLLFFYLYMPEDTPNRTSGFLWSLGLLSLLPLTSTFFYIPGKETDHEKVLHRQRMASFIIMMISYPVGWLVLSLLHAPEIFITVAINYTCITIGLLLINVLLKYKASGHAAGVAGPISAMIYLFGLPATPLLALLPLVSWARIRAKGHNFLQTVVGSALSLGITVLILWISGYHPFTGVIK